ncbi:MAG: DNA mismatch repair endonuclease MutL [Lachnospiraceae bacterium]|nr:DNA mismatch repair endonuclease MutL [Lachnospiraceae bacterium]
MNNINILDQHTIDQIAAGEVVERPVSVVKELVENAIDAGAKTITVEIKEGGISFIRVTDDGCGIDKGQLKKAFLRHATSKIRDALDLMNILSLGFRGEALSSIAAVSRVEVITKTRDALTGIHYILTAGEETGFNEIGAPNGSTFLVRNLFFNVPVRRKFLKQAQTEGSYITDVIERLALSHPDISFKYINNNLTRFHTSGNGDLREVIYRLFGKDIANNIIPISASDLGLGIKIGGFLGRPSLNRSNRNFEFFFINGRYVTSEVLKIGLEDGYHPYLMHHKFPFTVLTVSINTGKIDVNVHPGKLEVRLTDEKEIIKFVADNVKRTLDEDEHLMSTEVVNRVKPPVSKKSAPEPFEVERIRSFRGLTPDLVVKEYPEYKLQDEVAKVQENQPVLQESLQDVDFTRLYFAEQLNIFEEKFLSKEARGKYEVLGQLFSTYWLIAMGEKLIFIDQHAAHEKVKYEKLLKELADKKITSQNLNPPVVIELSGREEDILKIHQEVFSGFGFEIENFGDSSYTLRAVPADLFGLTEKGLFHEILDELSVLSGTEVYDVVEKKLAGAACKASVKANKNLSREEFAALIDELIELENPYFCPHGRPTMITMSKREIEKKFKRV